MSPAMLISLNYANPPNTHTHTLPFCLRWGCHSDSLTDTRWGERGGGGGDEKAEDTVFLSVFQ